MEKQLFLSFIVPVYNVEKYLEECLDSLLEQDIPHEEYEIICVNDGSTDGSLEILRRYEEKYPNIRVIDQENGGVCVARNTGLDAAQGEYIWFVDSDDFIRANILDSLHRKITNSKCDRLTLEVYQFWNALSDKERYEIEQNSLSSNSYLNNVACWNNVFRTQHLRKNNLYFRYPEIIYSEDCLFMFEFSISENVSCAYTSVCYFWRRHSNSATTIQNVRIYDKQILSYGKLIPILLEYYMKGLGDKQHISNLLMTNIWCYLYTAAKLPFRKCLRALKCARKNRFYPFRKPGMCKINKSYQTQKDNYVTKIFDLIYVHMHRPWGFWGMYALQWIIKKKHRIEGRE